jgi:hypothetical protein
MARRDEENDAEIRVQVPMTPAMLQRIDDLAQRMHVGRGRMAAFLLEDGLDDNAWVYKVVSHRFMKPINDLVHAWEDRKKGSRAKPTTE